jgi:hypothetical protein
MILDSILNDYGFYLLILIALVLLALLFRVIVDYQTKQRRNKLNKKIGSDLSIQKDEKIISSSKTLTPGKYIVLGEVKEGDKLCQVVIQHNKIKKTITIGEFIDIKIGDELTPITQSIFLRRLS